MNKISTLNISQTLRNQELDALRAYAIIFVFLQHASWIFHGENA